MNRYSYTALRFAAESGAQEDLNRLGEWFERYGTEYWNGEYYDADGINLFPMYGTGGAIVGWDTCRHHYLPLLCSEDGR